MRSKNTMLMAGFICLLLAYVFGSWAIDSGRWLHYFLAFLSVAVGLKLVMKFFRNGKE